MTAVQDRAADPVARREARALVVGFAAFGAFWGCWSALLPDLKAQTGLSDTTLGVALGAVALSALPAMPLAGRLVDRSTGPSAVVRTSLLVFAVVCPLVGLAQGLWSLVPALFALGAATGMLDVLLNTTTAGWERAEGRRLMTGAHGAFSVGVLTSSLSTGVARDLGATPFGVLSTVAMLLVAAAVAQPSYRPVPSEDAAPGGRRRLPPLLLVLGVLIAGSFLVEDALQSWSALHLERGLGGSPTIGGLGPAVFAGAMAVGRLTAHRVVKPGRDGLVVGTAGTLVGLGAVLTAVAPSPAFALLALGLAGAGVSVLAPTLLSAVGERSAPGRRGADLAAVTALGYLGFVTGPPLVGLVSGATSLPTALGLLGLVGVAVLAVGPWTLKRSAPAR